MAAAGQPGVYRGRKHALSGTDTADVESRTTAGGQKAQIARNFGLGRESFRQYLRRSE